MIPTDHISFPSAYRLRVAEDLMAGLKQEVAEKDELIARLQAELDALKKSD